MNHEEWRLANPGCPIYYSKPHNNHSYTGPIPEGTPYAKNPNGPGVVWLTEKTAADYGVTGSLWNITVVHNTTGWVHPIKEKLQADAWEAEARWRRMSVEDVKNGFWCSA